MELEPRPRRRSGELISLVIGLGAAFYLLLFWSSRARWTPAWFRRAQGATGHAAEIAVGWVVGALGGKGVPPGAAWVATSLVMGMILPWLFMALIGRGRPRDIGVRVPNRVGWRLMAVAYVVALPVLFVMARSPATRAWYRHALEGRTAVGLMGTYLAVLVAEHFMFHGILLALLRRERRWPVVPEAAPVEGSTGQRVLRFIGLAQPTGDEVGLARARRWLGIPEGCVGAMVFQAIVFAGCHANKAPVEALLSLPGGLALGYVAYRCNSVLCPLLLHIATGLTALGFIWLHG